MALDSKDRSKAGAENRFAPRRKMRIPAFLYVEGVMQPIGCNIADISTTGARLELKAGWDSAFRFISDHATRVRLFERIEKVTYECKVVRRSDTELGLKFLSPPLLSTAPVKKRRSTQPA